MCEISKKINLDEKEELEREIYRNLLKKCLTEICDSIKSNETEYYMGEIVDTLMVIKTLIGIFKEHIPNVKEIERRIDKALTPGSIKKLYYEPLLRGSMIDNQKSKIDLLIIDLKELVKQL